MDPVKEAFSKVKEDISQLKDNLIMLQKELEDIRYIITPQQTNKQSDTPFPAHNEENKAFQHINPADNYTPAHKMPLEGLKTQYNTTSIGNRGVPADRQTDRQTNQHTPSASFPDDKIKPNHLGRVSELLHSFDSLKQEVRINFKKLTSQEMLVFSTIYQLEEEGHIVDHSTLSKRLSLTESSIRDYIQRILKKGIPLIKSKEKNKKVLLSIDPALKKIASLSTIIQLREL